jgi:macrolide-specific efflux system membrane fusion protein
MSNPVKTLSMPTPTSLPQRLRSPFRRHPRLAWGIVVLLIAGAAAAFWLGRGGDEGELITVTARRGDIEQNVTALGNLQPFDYVDVGAQVSGQLRAIHVEIGDVVQQGDLLAEIDARLQQAKVDAAQAQLQAQRATLAEREAQLRLARDQYQRQVNLKRENATSEDAYQVAKSGLAAAEAQLSAIKAQIRQTESSVDAEQTTLGYTRIYAPRAGTVVSLAARQGQTLNANQITPEVLRIADLSTMTVWTQVSEADVEKLQPGMESYFTTLGNPDRRWLGRLRQILPTPEVLNNVVLYTALFEVDNPNAELKTQMTAQVFFVTAAARDAVIVPVSALQPVSGPRPSTSRRAEAAVGAPSEADAAAGARDRRGPRESNRADGPDSQRQPQGTGGQERQRGQRQQQYTVEVINGDGRREHRQVRVGVSNRVDAEIIEGLNEGEIVVASVRKADVASAQQPQRQMRPGGGLRGLR